jgi:ABC-type Fe3+-hydroxamate transport system substrate-binding protein
MAFYIDQLGRSIELLNTPKRIISVVPSQTELLFDLGLHEEVIGITKFCIHPESWHQTKTRVGGTKQLHPGKIKELQPDLIIANKEENDQQQIEELSKYFPVWISDVNNLDGALKMIRSIGDITNKKPQARQITDQIKNNFSQLQTSTPIAIGNKRRTCYLIWKDPYMTVGGDTFINDMLKYAGFQNIFSQQKRYPQVTTEKLQTVNCQFLLLSSEPFPFKQKQVDELQPLIPNAKIILVDGEMFSWYGSRLLKAPAYFQQLQNQILSLTNARGTE